MHGWSMQMHALAVVWCRVSRSVASLFLLSFGQACWSSTVYSRLHLVHLFVSYCCFRFSLVESCFLVWCGGAAHVVDLASVLPIRFGAGVAACFGGFISVSNFWWWQHSPSLSGSPARERALRWGLRFLFSWWCTLARGFSLIEGQSVSC